MASHRPDYHIVYKPHGKKTSRMKTIVPLTEFVSGGTVVATDHGSVSYTRAIWEQMVREGDNSGLMRHPQTGELIDFAQLRHGGHFDEQNNAHEGVLCEQWTPEAGRTRHFDPEALNVNLVATEEQPAYSNPANSSDVEGEEVAEVTGSEVYSGPIEGDEEGEPVSDGEPVIDHSTEPEALAVEAEPEAEVESEIAGSNEDVNQTTTF